MVIAVRGTPTTGPNSNASSTSISLAAGVTTGDVSIIAYVQARNSYGGGGITIPVITPPAGYTVLYNQGPMCVCWRAFQGGDATTGISASSTVSDWWESASITYSGLDTSNPIDASNFCNFLSSTATFAVKGSLYRAPSLNPNYDGSRLLCIFASAGSSGLTIPLPSGLTAQANTGSGPALRLADKALSNGTPTGDFEASVSSPSVLHFGMQIALKASGAAAATLAAARPAICGLYNELTASATPFNQTLLLEQINVQDGDIVAVLISGPEFVTTPPSGYTARASSNLGALLYTKTWSTGDSKSPVFTFDGNSGSHYRGIDVALIRKVGVDVNSVNFDQVAQATASGTTTVTVTVGTLTPANANELLIVFFGSSTTNGGTISSVTGGLTVEENNPAGPLSYYGWAQPPANPTGSFSATWASAGAAYSVAAFAALFLVGTGTGGGGGGGSSSRMFLVL